MKTTIEYLDELSEKVISNLDNDLCGAYYIAFAELITAFVEGGVFAGIGFPSSPAPTN